MDESGIPLDPRAPDIIARRGQKKVRYRISGKKEQITMLACGNAIGQAMPPMVMFDGKNHNYQWMVGEVPGMFYGMSNKGWTDQELFRCAEETLPEICCRKSTPAATARQKEEVIIFCLPPHTTQDSQPLDCTVFGSLKCHWTDVCHDFQQQNAGVTISKLNFPPLSAKAWLLALTPANIVAGFKKCRVYPYN